MANVVSLLRMLMAFGVIAMLFVKTQQIYLAAFVLTIIVIWMDGLDGYLARKFNETSKFGAVWDILCDRVVELTYWIGFLALGWIPVWIPLVVTARGVLVDGLRSMALEHGQTAFGSTSMMQSKLGVLLVSSRFSRWTYAVCKAVCFALLVLAYTPGLPVGIIQAVTPVAYATAYITVVFCVLRGLPVLVEARRYFK